MMEKVTLFLPLKSEYAIIARLAASGYCARAGIDIEKTEDIKVTISEVLNRCILSEPAEHDRIIADFWLEDSFFYITFSLTGIGRLFSTDDKDDLGISIINALCDSFRTDSDDRITLGFEYKERI